jgi:hypothetical protein
MRSPAASAQCHLLWDHWGRFRYSGAAQAARFCDCNTGRLAPCRYKGSGIGLAPCRSKQIALGEWPRQCRSDTHAARTEHVASRPPVRLGTIASFAVCHPRDGCRRQQPRTRTAVFARHLRPGLLERPRAFHQPARVAGPTRQRRRNGRVAQRFRSRPIPAGPVEERPRVTCIARQADRTFF